MLTKFIFAVAAGVAQAACPNQDLLPLPADPSVAGPWPVGARNLGVLEIEGRSLRTEVWYPGTVGSETGLETVAYDISLELPSVMAQKIRDADLNPPQETLAFADLPLDIGHGPYPVMVFIHGTGGWFAQSVEQTQHWASRGFIVFSMNHPGISLKDLLCVSEVRPPFSDNCENAQTDQSGDAAKLISLIDTLDHPALEFLRGKIDYENSYAISGHSAGGNAAGRMGDYGKVLIPMAAGGSSVGSEVISTLVLGARNDTIVRPASQENGYANSPSPKRIAMFDRGTSPSAEGGGLGHHFCSSICYVGEEDGGIAQIAIDSGINQAVLFRGLAEDGCAFQDEGFDRPELGWEFVNYMSSAVLEEVLMCNPDMTDVPSKYGDRFNGVFSVDFFEESL